MSLTKSSLTLIPLAFLLAGCGVSEEAEKAKDYFAAAQVIYSYTSEVRGGDPAACDRLTDSAKLEAVKRIEIRVGRKFDDCPAAFRGLRHYVQRRGGSDSLDVLQNVKILGTSLVGGDLLRVGYQTQSGVGQAMLLRDAGKEGWKMTEPILP